MITTKKIPIKVTQKKKELQLKSSNINNKTKKRQEVRGTKEPQHKKKTVNKMAIVNHSLLIITLNINGLSYPIKRYRLAV